MRFLVDLFRYLIIGFCGLVLIGVAYAIATTANSGILNTTTGVLWLAGSAVTIISMILALGFVAIAISIHDRHAELVREVERIADVFEHQRASDREFYRFPGDL